MADKFKLGDVVTLKSGGPPMTIAALPDKAKPAEEQSYRCRWFRGATQDMASFSEILLIDFVPPAK